MRKNYARHDHIKHKWRRDNARRKNQINIKILQEKANPLMASIKNPNGYITFLSIADQMYTVMALKHQKLKQFKVACYPLMSQKVCLDLVKIDHLCAIALMKREYILKVLLTVFWGSVLLTVLTPTIPSLLQNKIDCQISLFQFNFFNSIQFNLFCTFVLCSVQWTGFIWK